MEQAKQTKPAIPQKVRWTPGEIRDEVGMQVESADGVGFVPWVALKPELEHKLLIHMGRVLGDKKYTTETLPFHGRQNWLIGIVDEMGKKVGSVWLGSDPYENWKWDGFVRLGCAPTEHKAKVWAIFERYTDGSYRRIAALDTEEDRVA